MKGENNLFFSNFNILKKYNQVQLHSPNLFIIRHVSKNKQEKKWFYDYFPKILHIKLQGILESLFNH